MKTVLLSNGWELCYVVDDDGHLNLYIDNDDGTDIVPVSTGQGDGIGEQYALRFTTKFIERVYKFKMDCKEV